MKRAGSFLLCRLLGVYHYSTLGFDLPKATIILICCLLFSLPGFAQGKDKIQAHNDKASVNEDEVLVGTSVLENDDHFADAVLTAVLTQAPAHGSLSLNSDGTYTYTPAANYNGADFFRYKATDAAGEESKAVRVNININPVNDAPVATADVYNVQKGATFTLAAPGVLSNDTDIDGDVLTAVLISSTANGILNYLADGSFTYTHDGSATTTDSFSYKVNDSSVDGNTVTVTIKVTSDNNAPQAIAQSVSTHEDASLAINLSGIDADGDALSYTVNSLPIHGTFINGTYTPDANYNGTDSFTFTVNDGALNSAPATVSITVVPVNDAPQAISLTITVTEDVAKNITLAGTDADGDDLLFTVVTPPAHGILSGTAPLLTYTPKANYYGPDLFEYTVHDGELEGASAATVSITVTPVNDAPVAYADQYTLDEGASLTIAAAGVLANDADAEGNPLLLVPISTTTNGSLILNSDGSFTYVHNGSETTADSFSYSLTDGSENGNTAVVSFIIAPVNDTPLATSQSVTTKEDETASIILAGSDAENSPLTFNVVTPPTRGTFVNGVYKPAANYYGPDSFTFTASDGELTSAPATVSISVTAVNDAPEALAQSATVAEDGSVGIRLAGKDAEDDVLTYALVSPPVHGSISGTAPDLVYTPNANYNGSDSFTFKVDDSQLTAAAAIVTITVTPVNDAPVAVADSYTVNEGAILNIAAPGIVANDTDADGDAMTAILVSSTTNGTLTLNPNGSFSYTHNGSETTLDSFSYKVKDGGADSNITTVVISVTAINDVPAAVADTYLIKEDEVLNGSSVLVNDTDADDATLTAVLVDNVEHGSLTLKADGTFSYSPSANFFGTDSFTYKAVDATNTESKVATVTITVVAVNDAPAATAQTVTTVEDGSVSISLAGSDVDNSKLTFTVVTLPAHGTFENGSYTPAANYHGPDSFTYTASDGQLVSAPAIVTITVSPVNDAPVATAQSVSTDEDVVIAIILAGTDPEGDALTYTVDAGPTHGTLSGTAPNLTYTPEANYFGLDSFSFHVFDGAISSAASTFVINITEVNDVPTALAQAVTTNEDVAVVIKLAGTDPEGDALTFTVETQPAHGVFENGTYTPTLNFIGTDSFTFTTSDGNLTSALSTISIKIVPVNDAPVAAAQTITVEEDASAAITLTGTDTENSSLTYTILTSPANGTLSGTPPLLMYSPAANYSGPDSFSFRVSDETLNSTAATVAITVSPVNDAPISVTDTYSINEGAMLRIPAPGVAANDFDIDNSSLTVILISRTTNGNLSLQPDGSFTYVHDGSETTTDSFTYKVSDGTAEGNTATVTFTINPVNDAPVAVADAAYVNEDEVLIGSSVLVNDTDADHTTLNAELVENVSHGSLALRAEGTYTYSPAANYTGTDSFSYKALDAANAESNIVTVSIVVTPVNDAPVAAAQDVTTDEDVSVAITLTGSDIENSTLLYSIVTPPAHGTFSNGTYTPNAHYHGSDSFSFTASDGALTSAPATVSLMVSPVNDAPEATAQSVTTDEDVAIAIILAGKDLEGDALTYIVGAGPTHGTLSGTAPNLRYTPAANYFGPDSFSFHVNDGTLSSGATTIVINITEVNDVPLAEVQSLTTLEDLPVSFTLVGTDADGDALTFSVATPPANGTLSGNAPAMVYLPRADYSGTDLFTFRVNDGTADSPLVTVAINVTPVNDLPIAQEDSYTVDAGAVLEITAPGLLVNDTDADGDALSAAVVSSPAHGTLALQANGSFTYTHDGSTHTTDIFSYKVSDGSAASNTATVTITVSPIKSNNAPLALDDSFVVRENRSVAGNVLINDSDPDNDALTVATALVIKPAFGTFHLDVNGNFTYTPAPNTIGEDQFTYQVCDAASACATAVVKVTILPYDSDHDGIPDVVEYRQDAANPVDTDGDGIPDYLDTDSDNDGIIDSTEAGEDAANPADTDEDGLPDYIDTDSDEDGKADAQEGVDDCDADGILNYLDNEDPCLEKILISEGLSPNGDRNNDFWKIYLIEKFPANKVMIYNRWGALVFSMNGYNNEDRIWTGESNQGSVTGSDKLTDGTYYYLINLGDGSKTYSGYVVIRR